MSELGGLVLIPTTNKYPHGNHLLLGSTHYNMISTAWEPG
jgi:hypothetical protein